MPTSRAAYNRAARYAYRMRVLRMLLRPELRYTREERPWAWRPWEQRTVFLRRGARRARNRLRAQTLRAIANRTAPGIASLVAGFLGPTL